MNKERRACKSILTITIAVALFLSLFLTFSVDNECLSAPGPQSKPLSKKWTFMVYFANDNSLNDEGYTKLHDEIKPLGSDENVDIVVLMDYRGEGADLGDGKTHLYYVEPGELIEFTGIFAEEENTADPCILSKFVNWTIDNYPSEHYCLSVWDHGDGWDTSGGNCADDHPVDTMKMTEMKKAFSWIKEHLENATGNAEKGYSGVHLDVVGYDECLMAQFEVEYQFKDYLNIIVASEEVESSGWPYDTILSHLKGNSSWSPEELAAVIVDDYMDSRPTESSQTMSAYNLTRLDNDLSEKTNDFFQLLKHKAGTYNSEIGTARSNTESYPFPSGGKHFDLYDFASEINNTISDQEIKDASQELMESIKYSCIKEEHREEGMFAHPNTYGIHFYFPTDGSNHWGGDNYRDLDSSIDTQLDEFLDHYASSEDSTNLIPTCSITNPSEGEVVDGNYTVSGSASDDDGVDYVQIKIDRGAWQNATGTTAWSWIWNTTQYSNGDHTIFVRSSDLDDDADYSSTVIRNVTVNNGGDISVEPPTNSNAELTGSNYENITVTWTKSADDGGGENDITGYEIYYNQTYSKDKIGYTLLASLGPGNTSYVHENDGLNTTNSFYYIVAKDDNDNTAASDDQAGKFVRELPIGRQLVSIPLVQSDTALTTVFQTIEGSYSDVQWYNSTDTIDHWKTYSTDKTSGFNDLLNADHKIALWITMVSNDNLAIAGRVSNSTSIQLYTGWNFVGYPSFTDRSVSKALTGLPYDQVEGFDEISSPYYLKILSDDDIMTAGQGYWISVTSDCTWTVEH